MPHIHPISINDAPENSKPLLETVQKKFGKIPNILGTMAHSPVALEAYLGLSGTAAKGNLSPALREQVALAIAQANDCGYCLAAHSMMAEKCGVSKEEALKNRTGEASDPKAQAAVTFAKKIVEAKGLVQPDDIQAFKNAGFGDGDVAEIVALVALNIFTNYFNHVADTEIDFPPAPPLP